VYSSMRVGTVTMQQLQLRRSSMFGGVACVFGGSGFLFGSLTGKVVAGLELIDTPLVDVEAAYGTLAPEFDGKRKANITQAYDGKLDVL
jgi:hypothetical protein